MKTKFILAIALMLSAFGVNAQFYGMTAQGPVLQNTANFVAIAAATNIPSTFANLIPVGPNGVGIGITFSSTNAAAATTNMLFTFEGSQDGIFWIDSPATALPKVLAAPNGAAEYTVYTNLLASNPNIGNLKFLRLKTINNTNAELVGITNFTYTVR